MATIEIDERRLTELDHAARAAGRSREELLGEALDEFLERRAEAISAARPAQMRASFGAWRGQVGDGLEEQRRMRDEWD